MSSTEYAAQGDVNKPFTDTLLIAGSPPPLTGCTVWFCLTGPDTIERQATIVDDTTGEVSYTTEAGDLDTPGLYRQAWEVRYDNGVDKLTFPDSDLNWLTVLPAVAAAAVASA